MIQVCSIDIGKKNFAFCIEEFDSNEFSKIKNIVPSKRYNEDGTPTLAMTNILNQVYANGQIILYKNVDLTQNCDSKKKLDPETYHNMIDVLDKYLPYFDKCSVFLIEEQMSFGKRINTMALKLGQHCYSYFTIKYGRMKTVLEFHAYYKTQILGAPKVKGVGTRWKSMEKPQRKKWSVNQAIEILTCRGEMDILDTLTSVSKKDDLADVLNQLQAMKYLVYVDKKL